MGAGAVWTQLRYDTSGVNHELILQGPGLSGAEQIYIGIKTYHDVNADYYNLAVSTFTGYVAGNTFETQPGVYVMGVPAHNTSITYWLVANGQRLAMALKVGTPVYESFYIGKFFPYATPQQFPYPIVVGGMFTSAAATRFSDTTHSMPYKGCRGNFLMRWLDGGWKLPDTHPWYEMELAFSHRMRETDVNTYPLLPVVLKGAVGLFGELDSIYYVSGFNNAVENVIQVGGQDYLVVQDVWRTGFTDYYALKLA